MRNPPTVENATTKSPLPLVPDEPVLGSDRFWIFIRHYQVPVRLMIRGCVVVMTLGGGNGGTEEDPIC